MAVGDLYELTLTQDWRSREIANVFTLHQELAFIPVGGNPASVLATNFAIQVLPAISAWQPADLVTIRIRARNLFSLSDDFTLELATVGGASLATQSLPIFSAVNFSFTGDNPAVKNGSKRFAGLSEDIQDDGVITNATFISQMNVLADKMEGYVEVGILLPDKVFKFVVVKRIRSGIAPNYTYRMPATSAEGVFSAIVVAAFRALITSQVSRKLGS